MITRVRESLIRLARTQQIVCGASQPASQASRQGRVGGWAGTRRRRRFKISESSLGFPLTALCLEDEEAKREETPKTKRRPRTGWQRVGGLESGGSLAGRGSRRSRGLRPTAEGTQLCDGAHCCLRLHVAENRIT